MDFSEFRKMYEEAQGMIKKNREEAKSSKASFDEAIKHADPRPKTSGSDLMREHDWVELFKFDPKDIAGIQALIRYWYQDHIQEALFIQVTGNPLCLCIKGDGDIKSLWVNEKAFRNEAERRTFTTACHMFMRGWESA